ncbi:hypothetical protein ACEXQD_02555 [Herbiconiux sp. P15]|uniref:hypothetical protein n=1 Tax=Herbiconiux liukaitaii TaxID=3342799 RepID=UPI0035B6DA3C
MHPDFAEYHRARRRAVLPGRIALVLVAVAVVAGATWGIATRPVPTSAASASGVSLAGAPAAGSAAGATAGESPVPVPPPSPAPEVTTETVVEPRPQLHESIAVTARGHQAELDECQWVRMDIGAVAPIVGAHTYCEGEVVLELEDGDLVSIRGTELDGDYQVTGSRDAHAGDDPAAATAGLTADLLLQTCYWDQNGLRLVELRRVDLSLPPTPAAG